jgi:hypothetical protein
MHPTIPLRLYRSHLWLSRGCGTAVCAYTAPYANNAKVRRCLDKLSRVADAVTATVDFGLIQLARGRG